MRYLKYLILVLLLMSVVWPTRVFAKDLTDDQVIFGSSYTLESGDSLDGSLVVIGGTATVENAATLNGDLVLIGGTVSCDGTVNGSLVGIGGTVKLGDACLVNGDLVTMGASLNRAQGARVNGDVISGPTGPLSITTPEGPSTDVPGVTPPEVIIRPRNIFLDIAWFFFRTFMWAALAVLLVMFLYKPTDRVARAAVSQPVVAGGAGLITAFLAPFVLIALT
ncbi:MAG: hypothetical protein JW862_14120, partial [Anaerolineales bacterium]|nr:hypothetical protein [Anaerolineales bacterium]